MIRFCSALAALVVAFVPPAGAMAASQTWAQAHSDVAPDPSIRFGQLPNGMLYAIQRNDTPAHETSIRLRIGSGSLEERDDQQGLAHFLEHMAFKGSTHVPEGEMIKLLEQRGLAFGPDTNAYTSFDETVFMLDLPESDPETLNLGLMLMRETAGELTLSQKAMDPERGVVLSEERLRATPDFEALKKRLLFLFPGQLAPHRLPIGQVDVLKTAPVSLIRQYYEANYRPDRAQLVIVGDIDPAAIEAKIKAAFGDWKPVGPETKTPDYGALAPRGPDAQLIVQPGAHASLSIAWLKPFEETPETEAKDRRLRLEGLATAVLNRRLERLAQGEAPPFVGAGASVSDQFRSGRVASISILPKPGGWATALEAALKIEQQAAAFGVTQAEVDREIVEARAGLQSALAGAATRKTPDLAQEIVRSIEDDEIPTSPAQDLDRFDRDVKGLTAAEVSQVLKTVFSGQGPVLTMTSPDPIEGGEGAVKAAFLADLKEAPVAAAAAAVKTWPYADFGAPGRVVERREVKDLNVTFVRFANGVRLNLRPSALRKDQVLVNVRIGDGRLGLPKDRKSVTWATSAWVQGGLGKITLEDMQEVLASHLYGAQPAVADDALVLSGATRPSDLAVQMQVLAAYVADPGLRPSGFERIRSVFQTQLKQLDSTPGGVFAKEGSLLEHSGDLRWAFPTLADVDKAKPSDLDAFLRPQLSNTPLEVVVTGDVDVDAVIAAVGRTFGALPPRPAPAAPAPSALDVRFPAGGGAPVSLTHKGRADQAIADEAWPTQGLFVDPQRARAINIAAEVLKLRLIDEVRIAEGATYSPSVSSTTSEVFPTYGVVQAEVETPPAKIPGFFKTVDALAADLAAKGPTPDELQRALKPRIESLTKSQETNEYWLTWLAGADLDPRRLDVPRTTISGYKRLTAEDVRQAAAAFFTPAKAWRLQVTAADAPGK
jgi:zinc protease